MASLVFDEIERGAMALSRSDRERLAADLLAGLEQHPLSEIDQAWLDEAEVRFDQLITGRVQGVSAEEALSEVREMLRRSCKA